MLKRKRIQRHLEKNMHFTPFEYLLQDYLSGGLKQRLADMRLDRIRIYVDDMHWCISVYAEYGDRLCLDFQADAEEVVIALDEDEPEDGVFLKVPPDGDAGFYYEALAEQLRLHS